MRRVPRSIVSDLDPPMRKALVPVPSLPHLHPAASWAAVAVEELEKVCTRCSRSESPQPAVRGPRPTAPDGRRARETRLRRVVRHEAADAVNRPFELTRIDLRLDVVCRFIADRVPGDEALPLYLGDRA
jgi:hypothetical protein